jgi:Tfp pilus assembly protein PilN
MSLMTQHDVEVTIGSLPRVNLLPAEIAEARRFRQIKVGLGCAIGGAVAVVGLLYVGASSGVSGAQTDLDSATARHASLQAQTTKYRDVTAVYARASAAQGMLTQAMGEEVRFSQFLNDLSLTVPENVWLKNVTFTQTTATTPAAPNSATAITTPGIGNVSFQGTGFSHDDVALWLESLAGQKGYADPYFTSASEALLGTRKTVTFTSTATLTSAAYSGRYNKPAGG